MTELNIPLMTKVLYYVEANPKSFDMSVWGEQSSKCGTVGCIALHACLLSGYEMVGKNRGLQVAVCFPGKNGVYQVSATAQELLGLSEHDADLLFLRTNTVNAPTALKRLIAGEDMETIHREQCEEPSGW
jgi:hypothetical protein